VICQKHSGRNKALKRSMKTFAKAVFQHLLETLSYTFIQKVGVINCSKSY
jgi:hypothetical protein